MIPKGLEKFTLTTRVWKDEEAKDLWLADCAEFKLVAQGNSLPEVLRNIGDMCALQIEYAEENDNWEYLWGPKVGTSSRNGG